MSKSEFLGSNKTGCDILKNKRKETGQVAVEVLEFCKMPHKSKEIQELVGIKHRGTFRDNYLLPIIDKGWLAMTIPGKPQSSKQRYVTTEKGKETLREFGKIEF